MLGEDIVFSPKTFWVVLKGLAALGGAEIGLAEPRGHMTCDIHHMKGIFKGCNPVGSM